MLAILLRVLHADITVGDGSTYAQPQINPLSATENPHSLIEMTRLLGTVASLTA